MVWLQPFLVTFSVSLSPSLSRGIKIRVRLALEVLIYVDCLRLYGLNSTLLSHIFDLIINVIITEQFYDFIHSLLALHNNHFCLRD